MILATEDATAFAALLAEHVADANLTVEDDAPWRLYFDGERRPMRPGPFATKAAAEAWYDRHGFPDLRKYVTARQEPPRA